MEELERRLSWASLPASPERKGLTWREFVAWHKDVLLCADLFTKEDWTFYSLRRAFVLTVMHVRSRTVAWRNIGELKACVRPLGAGTARGQCASAGPAPSMDCSLPAHGETATHRKGKQRPNLAGRFSGHYGSAEIRLLRPSLHCLPVGVE